MKLKDRVRLLRSHGLKSTPAAIWDQQFKAGQWDFLGKFTEVPRNAVVGGYCRLASSNPAILDVGCGTGVLQTWLGSGGYAEYVGVDLSAAAIDQAQARANANTHFAVSAGESYTPDRTFDVIVFNESLCYMVDPVSVVRWYSRFLTETGRYVISLWDCREGWNVWRTCKRELIVLDETRVVRSDASWRIRSCRPIGIQKNPAG